MSEKITLADQIYADIKKDITNKQLVSGEKINIKELARKYGVSDTPVKQALQRLAEEKLVVNTLNKGMSVRTLTPHELNDTFDIRLMMDTFFIKDIITTLNYNSTLRQQLLENMEKQKQFISCNDSTVDAEGYFQLDLEFHVLYLTASRQSESCGSPQRFAALHILCRHILQSAPLSGLRMCGRTSGDSGRSSCCRSRRTSQSHRNPYRQFPQSIPTDL